MSEVVLHTKLRELEEELRSEREVRFKYEKDIGALRVDIDELDVQLYEAKSARDREIEASKRLKQELADLKHKMESQINEHEEALIFVKRKHQDTIGEISSHLDSLSKSKLKFEKENKQHIQQIEEMRSENDSLSRAKSHALNTIRDLESKQADAMQRIDELTRQLTDSSEARARLAKENAEYFRRTAIVESDLQQNLVNLKRMSQELDDATIGLENERLEKHSLENKYKNLLAESEALGAQLDEESEARIELQKSYNRLQDEFKASKDRMEKEAQQRYEESEDARRRLNNRYLEAQEQLSDYQCRFTNADKNRQRLQGQLDALTVDFDALKKRADDALKHEKALEKDNEELKSKLSLANIELDEAFQSSRTHASELSKHKHLAETLAEQLESLQKEKRKQSDELEVTSNQLLEAQSRLTDVERRIKLVEADNIALENELDEARDHLQLETSRNQSMSAQIDKLKLEMEKKLSTKKDECDMQRVAHRRQLDALQAQLDDAEKTHKSELSTLKKKHATECDELAGVNEALLKARADLESQIKKLQQAAKELADKLAEEQEEHDAIRDQLSVAEKRNASLRAELDEAKLVNDRIEKARKALDAEHHEMEEKMVEVQASLNRALGERKKLESDAMSVSDELHEAKFELKSVDEKLRALNASLLKKDEDQRRAHDLCAELESEKKACEQQLRDALARLDEADEVVKRELKRLAHKLESRIEQLEMELDDEKSKEQEWSKKLRSLEKRNKELLDALNDEHVKMQSIGDAYDKLQERVRKYKGQVEGAEEQAAANISKCKRLERELEEAEDRVEKIAHSFIRAGSVNRIGQTESFDDAADTPLPSLSHWRSKYDTIKSTTDLDDLDNGVGGESGANLADDDNVFISPSAVPSRPYKFSTYSSSYKMPSLARHDRARSIANMYDSIDNSINTRSSAAAAASSSIAQHQRRSAASRNSVSRLYDDLMNEDADSLLLSGRASRLASHSHTHHPATGNGSRRLASLRSFKMQSPFSID